MRTSWLLALAALVWCPHVLLAQKDTDCRGLRLTAVSGLPDGPIHVYNFEGTCRVFETAPGHVFADPATMNQFTRAEIRWVAATGEVHERVTTEGKYPGVIEMFLRCTRDPVFSKDACTHVSYNNSTGWPGFDGAWNQYRPITRGKTTQMLAQTLQAQGQALGKTAHDPGPGGGGGPSGGGPSGGSGIGGGGQGGPPGNGTMDAVTHNAPSGAAKTMTSPSGAYALEAEAMIAGAQVTHGRIGAQNMRSYGTGWGGNTQLFWEVSQPGAQLRLLPAVPRAGRFEVLVVFTKAPDFGLFKASFDGMHEILVNGYAPTVSRDSALVGMFDLTPGPHELLLSIAGRDPSSRALYVGIDRIVLRPVR